MVREKDEFNRYLVEYMQDKHLQSIYIGPSKKLLPFILTIKLIPRFFVSGEIKCHLKKK